LALRPISTRRRMASERTLPGLLAMIVYANELDDEDPEVFSDCRQTLATAAQALMNGRG
jgi:hypothetical protein